MLWTIPCRIFLIRYKRMQGYEALWQPGTDHAAIATEVKVIDKLKRRRFKGRPGKRRLLKGVLEVEREYGTRIVKAASQAGFFCRLGQRALYHGRRLLRRSFGSICKTLREKDTSTKGFPHHQLVSCMPDLYLRRGGRARKNRTASSGTSTTP